MMKKWNIKKFGSSTSYQGDWGTELLPHVNGIENIEFFDYINREEGVLNDGLKNNVYIKVQSGVIYIGSVETHLGINLGGYGHKIEECEANLIKMSPYTTAVFNISTKNNEDLDFHLLLGYEITAVKDKVSGEMAPLSSPVYKEFLVYFTSEGVLIC
jgi:hypothetical protein